jgi:hypothetical protein
VLLPQDEHLPQMSIEEIAEAQPPPVWSKVVVPG